MFTGIIEEIGTIEAVHSASGGARLKVRAAKVMGDMKEGDSISVDGVCLTAVELRKDGFSADVSPETLKRSTLGGLASGSPVNLERALTPGSRIGGHIVQGHVDTTGEIESIDQAGAGNWWLTVRPYEELDRYLVEKGSVAVDGISLTIAAVEVGRFSIAIIPHTFEQTALKFKRPGDPVNIEADILAKHVEKLLQAAGAAGGKLTAERLRELGW